MIRGCLVAALLISARSAIAGAEGHNVTSTLQGRPYDVRGDRVGRIIVRSSTTGRLVTTLDMRPGAVRTLFLLDRGTVLAASQAKRTMFWDLPSGRLRQTMAAQIYAFSHDGKSFVTAAPPDISVNAYPSEATLCRFAPDVAVGIEKLLYSPDDRYLAVVFASGWPSDDAHFPGPNPVYRSTAIARLFDLSHCAEIDAFTRLKAAVLGVFTPDGKYYDLRDAIVDANGGFRRGSWRFDLATRTLTRLPD